MTKEILAEYRSKKDEIKELMYKLEHLGEGDSFIGNDVIFDYRSGYPVPQAVIGFDQKKYNEDRTRLKRRISRLIAECQQVEDFIEDIKDSTTRRIFRMHYSDGMSQKDIAKAMHFDKSTISRKIDNYLKIATNATDATL